ncbi:hypothetical protein AWM68_17435 [Fictibacillus phosphorivorans]|uniref:Response regulatory domain-containing protein n=1 Tax=Fictibacillus phosphorivorans TaxID=1221500 RepID=A0A165NWH3_9BACL|nr:response regulator transcription factor [Fictibacillus phosphorivorans]KZE67955.1 hypothetical protein AWM68_17435 [Fictibacillus phosphorivorans]
MENILIINERGPFREGLRNLMELKFGRLFSVIGFDARKLKKQDKTPRLIIVEQIENASTENYLKKMKRQGAKVILLISHEEGLKEYMNFEIFSGFLLKNMKTNDMLQVIEEILDDGEVYVHPEIGSFFLKKLLKTEN